MTIGVPVRFFIVAYMFLLFILMVVLIPFIPVVLLITYIRDGTLELPYPGETQNE